MMLNAQILEKPVDCLEERNFDILPLFSATLPAEVELFYK